MSAEPKSRNRGAFLFFLVGTLSSLGLLLVLTVDTQRQVGALTHAEKLSEQVVAGKRAFEKYNCNDCHTILGVGAYYAPDLTKAYWRLGADGIRQRILQPEVVFANSFRKMPNQQVSEQEADNIAAFLDWISNIDTHKWPPQDQKLAPTPAGVRRLELTLVSPGAALFKEQGCMGCHKLGGVGGNAGPALDDVGSRLDDEVIAKIIVNPRSVKPTAQMPRLNVSEEDAERLAEFLAQQRAAHTQ